MIGFKAFNSAEATLAGIEFTNVNLTRREGLQFNEEDNRHFNPAPFNKGDNCNSSPKPRVK